MENIPRVLPKHLGVEIDALKWNLPPIFRWIQKEGNVSNQVMIRTFNCGLGMVFIVAPEDADLVLKMLKINGESDASIVGSVVIPKTQPVVIRNFANIWDKPIVPELSNKKRVAVLISGSGTNLQALIDHTMDTSKNSAAEIVLVISNIEGVAGLKRASDAGIRTLVIPHAGKKRVEFDMEVHDALVSAQIDFVVLAGFMRICSEKFVNLWEGRLINIHPSLLPSFKGMHTHQDAISAGVRVHGATVHFVDAGVDTGPIILQEPVPVLPNDTPEILQERVKLEAEHKIYPLALEHLARGDVVYDYQNKKAVWKL